MGHPGNSRAAPKPPAPIPLSVLTGFLGAGKTTLLSRLLQDPALADTAVLINELGEIGLDHLLVEHVEDGVVMLASGCLCCAVRGDLVTALERLLRDLDNGRAAFRRVVIETTGFADPAPVVHTIMAHPYLVMRYRLDGLIAVADAVNGLATLDRHQESIKQAAMADRIVLTKADLLDSPERRAAAERLVARLRALNPAAPILDAAAGQAAPGRLLDCGLYDPRSKEPDVRRWLAEEAYDKAASRSEREHTHASPACAAVSHEHAAHRGEHESAHHDDRVRTFSLSTERAIPAAAFEMFLDLVRSLHGPKLLRLKGVVKIAEHPETPLVIHGVQHIFHPPSRLPRWPDEDRRTRIVFITFDIDAQVVEPLFQAFLGNVAPDRPDREALVNNPLTPFGGLRD